MKRVLLFTFMAAFMCAAQVSAKELRKIVFKVDQERCKEDGNRPQEPYSNCNLRCREN